MTDYKITGMRFFDYENGDFRILAHADIEFTDTGVTISGASLAWSPQWGYTAVAPDSKFHGRRVVLWRLARPFAKDFAERMVAMYKAMGGALPEPAADDEPTARHDHVTGKPIGPDPFDAVDETMERAGLDKVLGADAQLAA